MFWFAGPCCGLPLCFCSFAPPPSPMPTTTADSFTAVCPFLLQPGLELAVVARGLVAVWGCIAAPARLIQRMRGCIAAPARLIQRTRGCIAAPARLIHWIRGCITAPCRLLMPWAVAMAAACFNFFCVAVLVLGAVLVVGAPLLLRSATA